MTSVDFLPKIGGVSLASHYLANALVETGCDVTFVAGADAAIGGDFPAAYKLVTDENARPKARDGRSWTEQELPRLTQLFDNLMRTMDIDRAIALHPFYYAPALYQAARRCGCPFSVMFHGFELRSQLIFRERVRSWKTRLRGRGPSLRDVTLGLLNQTDEVLTNSAYTAGVVRRVNPTVPIFVTGCGLEKHEAMRQIELAPDHQKQIRSEQRAALGITGEEILLGTISRLVPSKNIETLIRSVASDRRLKGLIIGNGPDLSRLQVIAEDLNVGDRIYFRHAVGEEEKWRLLRALDAFCLLSREGKGGEAEGFGIVLLEATAAGIPVIAAKSGGMRDVVTDGKTGFLVPPTSDASVVAAALRLKTDEDARRGMVFEAQLQIKTKFNWQSIAQRLSAHWELH